MFMLVKLKLQSKKVVPRLLRCSTNSSQNVNKLQKYMMANYYEFARAYFRFETTHKLLTNYSTFAKINLNFRNTPIEII